MKNLIISASITACDFWKWGEVLPQLEKAGVSWLHVDVMDGVFVKNLTIGFDVIKAMKAKTTLPFDVHLMIVQPERYVERFIDSGADWLTIHLESTRYVESTLWKIKSLGAKAGLSIRPSTPVQSLGPFLSELDLVLVMSVEPGFSGQDFQPQAIEKVQWLYEQKRQCQYSYLISVDGGIQPSTGARVRQADVWVVGSWLFKQDSLSVACEHLTKAFGEV